MQNFHLYGEGWVEYVDPIAGLPPLDVKSGKYDIICRSYDGYTDTSEEDVSTFKAFDHQRALLAYLQDYAADHEKANRKYPHYLTVVHKETGLKCDYEVYSVRGWSVTLCGNAPCCIEKAEG